MTSSAHEICVSGGGHKIGRMDSSLKSAKPHVNPAATQDMDNKTFLAITFVKQSIPLKSTKSCFPVNAVVHTHFPSTHAPLFEHCVTTGH
jgi:hypothetical protein